jgi:hypothetical protein
MLSKSQVRAIFEKMHVFTDATENTAFPGRVLQVPEYVHSLAVTLATSFRTTRPSYVITLGGGGAYLGYELAKALRSQVTAFEYGEIARGMTLTSTDRIVLCVDILKDPALLTEAIDYLHKLNVQILGVAVLIDATRVQWPFAFPLESLLRPEGMLTSPALPPRPLS